MPMRLRDGRCYAPSESEHMILRDGKSVEAMQAQIYNNFYCQIHGFVNFDKLFLKDRTSPFPLRYQVLDNRFSEHVNLQPVVRIEDILKKPRQSASHVLAVNSLTGHTQMKLKQNAETGFKVEDSKRKECHFECTGLQLQEQITCSGQEHLSTKAEMHIYRKLSSYLNQILLGFLFAVLASSKLMIKSLYSIAQDLFLRIPFYAFKFPVRVTTFVLKFLLHFGNCLLKTLVCFAMRSGSFLRQMVNSMFRHRAVILFKTFSMRSDQMQIPTYNEWHSCYRIIRLILWWLKVLITALTLTTIVVYWCNYHETLKLGNPQKFGVENVREEKISQDVSVWHIYPIKVAHFPSGEKLIDGSPVILHVRSYHDTSPLHRVNVLKSLNDMGFHVIAPINIFQEWEVKLIWSYLQEKVQKSDIYIWAEKVSINTLKTTVNNLCMENFCPAGVIIEREAKMATTVRNLEIWSEQIDSHGEKSKFNFLKCPLINRANSDLTDFHDEVAPCIHAVSLSSNFKARFRTKS